MSKKSSPKSKPSSGSRTLVTFLLDRTGSMESIKDDTIGAFNAYVDGLRDEKKAKIDFTLIQFDSQSLDKVCVAVPVAKAPKLDKDNFVPRAMTPLIDAAYKTIKAVETQLGDDKSTKVVVCIQTDGHENASIEHDWKDLNALIKEKTKLGWQFNFMGASIDAYDAGSKMGVMAANTMSYDSTDSAKTHRAFRASASNAALYARGDVATTAYSPSQKLGSGDAFDPALNRTVRVTVGPQPSSPAPPKKDPAKAVDDFSLTDGS